jgi:hypothetical protein
MMSSIFRKLDSRVLLYGGAAAFVVWLFLFGPQAQQTRNMKRAEEHIAKIAPLLEKDPKFRDVRLKPYTGLGGSLAVLGSVSSPAEMREVRDIVNASNPPVPVYYQLQLSKKEQAVTPKTR